MNVSGKLYSPHICPCPESGSTRSPQRYPAAHIRRMSLIRTSGTVGFQQMEEQSYWSEGFLPQWEIFCIYQPGRRSRLALSNFLQTPECEQHWPAEPQRTPEEASSWYKLVGCWPQDEDIFKEPLKWSLSLFWSLDWEDKIYTCLAHASAVNFHPSQRPSCQSAARDQMWLIFVWLMSKFTKSGVCFLWIYREAAIPISNHLLKITRERQRLQPGFFHQ